MVETGEYEIFNKALGTGIRNKSILNLMWVQLKLYEQYSKLNKENIRFSTYIGNVERIKDIEKLLNCSERTARDYLKALLYFELTNRGKLIIYQTEMEEHEELQRSG
jgi:hypothetical protein